MNTKKNYIIIVASLFITPFFVQAQKGDLTHYVNTLQGTHSNFGLSHGNTFPATAMPFGVHLRFTYPKKGDAWLEELHYLRRHRPRWPPHLPNGSATQPPALYR